MINDCFSIPSNTAFHFPDQPEPTKMTFDQFFSHLSGIPGGMIWLAMPHDADLTTLRFIASQLLPTTRETIVDDEMFFLYGSLEDFDVKAWTDLSKYQRRFIGKAMAQYMSALCALLSMYKCSFYRDWEARRSLAMENGGPGSAEQP